MSSTPNGANNLLFKQAYEAAVVKQRACVPVIPLVDGSKIPQGKDYETHGLDSQIFPT